jgi:hypothetical protein
VPSHRLALFRGGTTTISLDVWSDFSKYVTGVYVHDTTQNPDTDLLGGHAVACIGWGQDTGLANGYCNAASAPAPAPAFASTPASGPAPHTRLRPPLAPMHTQAAFAPAMHIRQSLRAALQGSLQTRGARRGARAGTAVYVLAQMRPSRRRRPCLPCRLCRRRALQHRRAPTVASSTRRANAAARLLRCGPARSATSARPHAKTVGRHAPPASPHPAVDIRCLAIACCTVPCAHRAL